MGGAYCSAESLTRSRCLSVDNGCGPVGTGRDAFWSPVLMHSCHIWETALPRYRVYRGVALGSLELPTRIDLTSAAGRLDLR